MGAPPAGTKALEVGPLQAFSGSFWCSINASLSSPSTGAAVHVGRCTRHASEPDVALDRAAATAMALSLQKSPTRSSIAFPAVRAPTPFARIATSLVAMLLPRLTLPHASPLLRRLRAVFSSRHEERHYLRTHRGRRARGPASQHVLANHLMHDHHRLPHPRAFSVSMPTEARAPTPSRWRM